MAITLTITQSTANITGYTVGQPYAFLLEYSGPTGSDSIRSPSSGYATITTATYTINISSVTTAYGTYTFRVKARSNGVDEYSSYVTYTRSAPQVEVQIVNYLNLTANVLYDGKATGVAGTSFRLTDAGTQYATYSAQYDFVGFRLSGDSYQTLYTDPTMAITIHAGLVVHALYKTKTAYVTITGYCGTGISSYTMVSSGGTSLTVSAASSPQSMQIRSGETVSFSQITPANGYGEPYSLYYNRSDSSGWYGPATTFNITDTSFDRMVRIDATLTKTPIAYFAWTTSDATAIVAGQPVKNLTASAWQSLITKVQSCGGNVGSIPPAYSGQAITANHFNQMRIAIASLPGAGTVAPSVTQSTSQILASYFANTNTALKEAVNRAIAVYNQS